MQAPCLKSSPFHSGVYQPNLCLYVSGTDNLADLYRPGYVSDVKQFLAGKIIGQYEVKLTELAKY